MATFNVTGIENIIRDLHRMGDEAHGVAEKMLFAGADVMVWEWQHAIQSAGLIDTGAMILSVKADKGIKTNGGMMQITVYPRGSDASGTRNAEKDFIANYGRTHQRADHHVDKAVETAQAPVWSAMEGIWDQFIK